MLILLTFFCKRNSDAHRTFSQEIEEINVSFKDDQYLRIIDHLKLETNVKVESLEKNPFVSWKRGDIETWLLRKANCM